MPKYSARHELLLLVIEDRATAKELKEMGFSHNTAYNTIRRAKKIMEEYYIQRRKLKALRNPVKEVDE